MPYREVAEKLAAYRREIAALRDKMRALQQQVEPEEVENYRFATSDGPVRLSDNHTTGGAILVAGNTVAGPLRCSGDTPDPVNLEIPNTVKGSSTGQCTRL